MAQRGDVNFVFEETHLYVPPFILDLRGGRRFGGSHPTRGGLRGPFGRFQPTMGNSKVQRTEMRFLPSLLRVLLLHGRNGGYYEKRLQRLRT